MPTGGTARGEASDLAAAMALHRAGRLDQAEAAYRAMLDPHPGHSDALHLLGVIASQRGQFEQAIELISRALASAPDNVHFLVNLC